MKLRDIGLTLRCTGLFVCALGLAAAAPAQNVPGVTEKEIVIGSCSALEGPSMSLGTQTVTGAKAYLASVNEEGGIHGRKLRLISYDDSYDPAKTEACFSKLMADKVFALGFFVGTPTAVKVRAYGGNQQDSSRGPVHRSADLVRATAALGDKCPGFLL